MSKTITIAAADMQQTFRSILLQEGFAPEKADACAEIFTRNSIDGVYTHGVNRFPVFVRYVKEGLVKKDAEPERVACFNGLEQWTGNLGPGPLNAVKATDRAMELAAEFGIGAVALAHTNHWMRGGYYGWQAAKKGFLLLAWTNTTALMPAWGAIDSRLGNNPLVLAVPYKDEAIVLDMAQSQYSFGSMEQAAARGESLHVPGGYDAEGKLSQSPDAILASRRPLPIGYWKGAGLSLLLDILAAMLSGGLSTHQVAAQKNESNLSQVFVCIDSTKLPHQSLVSGILDGIIADLHASKTEADKKARFPGEGVLQRRAANTKNGIPVLEEVWRKILNLQT